jgi:hypothetical protein
MATKSAETEAFDAKISRQRLDHFVLPDGSVEAVLTVTLPGRKEPLVFRERSTPAEARADLGPAGVAGVGEVGSIFGDIGKALKGAAKGIGKAVKSVASSKVFKAAAKGLAAIAPALGPLAPVALTTAGAMATTSALVGARRKAAHGDKRGAAVLTALAVSAAKKVAPKNHAALLKIAADKSRNAHALSVGSAPTKSAKPTAKPKATPQRALVSRTPAALSPAALLAAARAGRVYVIQSKAA